MRKFICGFFIILYCGCLPINLGMNSITCVYAQDQASEDAQIFFEEALTLKRKGNIEEASKMFLKSIRTSRSVLAEDDHGLIADLKKYCEAELKKDEKDLKMLDTLGFLYAVCYSDSENAIKYYQKVYDLSDSEKVKEKTQRLIDRIKATAEAEAQVQDDMAEQLRNERLQSWSELEKNARLAEQNAQNSELSSKLSDSYKQKDSLKNRVPQLEKELNDLNADYDKQNRRWFSTNDELYNRRRRRLRDQIAEKETELNEARSELDEVVETVDKLEQEDQKRNNSNKSSPIRSYEEDATDDGATSSDTSDSQPQSQSQPSLNDYGTPDASSSGIQQPPANDYGAPEAGQENNQELDQQQNQQNTGNVSSGTEESQGSENEESLPGLETEELVAPDAGEDDNGTKLDKLIYSL